VAEQEARDAFLAFQCAESFVTTDTCPEFKEFVSKLRSEFFDKVSEYNKLRRKALKPAHK